jgi:hypothetical protein
MPLYYYDIKGNIIKSPLAWHSDNFDESYEKVQALKRREMQYSTDDYLFLFGKYKDRLLSTMTNEIELSYVKWFYENVSGLGYPGVRIFDHHLKKHGIVDAKRITKSLETTDHATLFDMINSEKKTEEDDIWQAMLGKLSNLTKAIVENHCRFISIDGNEIVISVKTAPLARLLSAKIPELENCFSLVCGKKIKVVCGIE